MTGAELPPFPRPGALPYLTVADARDAIAWYAEVFDAELHGEPYVMPDDRIGHAELSIGAGTIYLADEFPDHGVVASDPDRVSVSLMIPVADTDATLERARARGATRIREPYEEYGGRNACFVDPFGHRWMLYGAARRERGTSGSTSATDDQ
ncbi:VOC family protein [Solicola gregarius]|uniref:Glyoxalase/bleomycin resistance/extradiol dioxygenase family protein n=1 Tax=Solicola gregarius TaxID=2908642 RepID=A0AA46THD1_9ACTN|nr:glyoxalase/bleomycin resistance/extradiol dioxygenase family protein [Solicola gregarius]UYM05379.1 glyoxalase/bleomycin resistance/extradiol dioxygenase family protein [Solicola gregarius]